MTEVNDTAHQQLHTAVTGTNLNKIKTFNMGIHSFKYSYSSHLRWYTDFFQSEPCRSHCYSRALQHVYQTHRDRTPWQREIHLRDEIQGLGEAELRPLKMKVTSQPFCLPPSDTGSQRKKKSRQPREEAALTFHQRTKRLPKKKRENINPQKHLTWIQKHQKRKKTNKKKM